LEERAAYEDGGKDMTGMSEWAREELKSVARNVGCAGQEQVVVTVMVEMFNKQDKAARKKF
jgi:hypothetical protein